jgi:hypothetical protein
MKFPLVLLVLIRFVFSAEAGVREVSSPAELKEALRALENGTTIRIKPGEYPGGWAVAGISDLTIEARDPKTPPVFRGGATGWHFSRCENLTVRSIVVIGPSQNGINIDDGGRREQPVRDVTLEGVTVRDVGPRGNCDGIKMSGIIDFTVRGCALEGWGGQGIDMVGCHRGKVADCEFRGKAGFSATAGIQIKGGSSDIVVEKCDFLDAGERALNLGGSTGRDFLRPPDSTCEARALSVRNCRIEGSSCAAAFVGLDGGEFLGNTVMAPKKWIFRILQETRDESFSPSRNVKVRGNRIVFRRADVTTDVNIGPGTDPRSFVFADNQWFAEDRPDASKPKLPVQEQNGIYGVDPRLDERPAGQPPRPSN